MRGVGAFVAVVLVAAACTPDVRLVNGTVRPVVTDIERRHDRTVYERRHEGTEARTVRWLGQSADGQTGFKEHLVGWQGPGSTPRKAVVPYPLVVHDGPYRFRATRIFGGPYRSRWGGWCWNYNYRAQQKPGVMNTYRAFACQARDGRWIAYKNSGEAPLARSRSSGPGDLAARQTR